MTIQSLGIALIVSFSVACGGSSPPAEEPSPGPAEATPVEHHEGEESGKGEAHEHNFPGSVNVFHDTLAPLWHAEKGEERTQQTCDAVPTLKEQAQRLVDEPAPEQASATAEEWKASATGLVGSVDALGAACAADGRPEFETAFHEVHEAFHAVVKLLGHEDR